MRAGRGGGRACPRGLAPGSVGPVSASGLAATRHTTLRAVQGLTTSQLDYLHDPQSNTIGALLGHIAAVEVAYQADTFEGRALAPRERQEWGTLLDLGERARREIRGHPVAYYLHLLQDVRQKTLGEFARRDADWLYE
ncbi:MAG: DUF664 domain-containing protein, partial [Candidatus Methylomirabilales bacterium]